MKNSDREEILKELNLPASAFYFAVLVSLCIHTFELYGLMWVVGIQASIWQALIIMSIYKAIGELISMLCAKLEKVVRPYH
jgi:hypothetical protein